jgi:hypothetical protein
MLDADALSTILTLILLHPENYPNPSLLLNLYSDLRRRVFQEFIDPTSTANKLRTHAYEDGMEAREHDWLVRELTAIERGEGNVRERVGRLMKPYFEGWRSDIKAEAEKVMLESMIQNKH